VLSRALEGVPAADVPLALRAYEDARRDRTAQIQLGSLANDWMRTQGNADWVYGYDAWSAPLGAPVEPTH
jgi:salicylate hydroxylase